MKISICIPTWEQNGFGTQFLKENFERIKSQTYKNFNVIISDHSKNNDIKKLCGEYSKHFEIKYIRNENYYGNSPANTNNSILNADGDIIKIIFQDDFLYSNDALFMIEEKFRNEKCEWLVCGCNHTYDDGNSFDRYMIPEWNDEIILGVNTISSPSVLAFKNNKELLFDEELTIMMDCEMYYKLHNKYDLPYIIKDTLVTNRIHQNQISNIHNGDISTEINYLKIKYNIK